MMNFLPQGFSFESRSNPYESQFISPFYGSGQYGWQYSPMQQGGPRLPTCQPGTCPPWLPPGLIATPSSGVQELSVLFDPTLAARMARAYNSWSVAYWGKPDIPAWLWPDGSYPQPVPPNVCCEVPPCVSPVPPGGGGGGCGGGGGPGGGPGGGGGGGGGGPQLTPGPAPGPKLTPGVIPKSGLTPGVVPQGSFTPGPVPSTPKITTLPGPSSAQPNPGGGRLFRSQRRRNPGVPKCGGAGDKGSCFRCCNEQSTSKAERQQCLNQCVNLPEPTPKDATGIGRLAASSRQRGRLARSAGRRARRAAQQTTSGWTALPGSPRGWCGPGEHLCTKKTPTGKSNFCCCQNGTSDCAGGKSVLAAY